MKGNQSLEPTPRHFRFYGHPVEASAEFIYGAAYVCYNIEQRSTLILFTRFQAVSLARQQGNQSDH